LKRGGRSFGLGGPTLSARDPSPRRPTDPRELGAPPLWGGWGGRKATHPATTVSCSRRGHAIRTCERRSLGAGSGRASRGDIDDDDRTDIPSVVGTIACRCPSQTTFAFAAAQMSALWRHRAGCRPFALRSGGPDRAPLVL